MIRVDCHVHTFASGDAITTIDELTQRVEEVGLDVICITDHHEISVAELVAAERAINARIIVGEEIRTPSGEIIGLFLNERIPYVLPLDEVVGRIRSQGGLTYAPHPIDPLRNGMREQTIRRLQSAGMLDIVEVFNAKTANDEYNQASLALAKELGLPGGVGSDAHDPVDIGSAWLEMPDFDGPTAFLESIHSATVHGEYAPYPLRYPGAFAAETAR